MGDDDNANYAYDSMQVYLCPSWALSLGYMGVASGAVLSNWGSAVSCLTWWGSVSWGVFNISVGRLLLTAVTAKLMLNLRSWCWSREAGRWPKRERLYFSGGANDLLYLALVTFFNWYHRSSL
eukprot:scaffold4386_cov138-Skeletonema_marinoi.AAC.9